MTTRPAPSRFVSCLGAAFLASAVLIAPASACPLCSEENEAKERETGVNVAMGFSVSVLVLLAVPMSLVGGLGYALYRNHQRMTQDDGRATR